MMMRDLCNFIFFNHFECKDTISSLNQMKAAAEKTIRSMEIEALGYINQIQELKAINNYQSWESEKKIAELEEQLKSTQVSIEPTITEVPQ